MAGEGATLDRGVKRAFLKRWGPQGQEDSSHVGMWGRDCLVEEMAGAKDLRWEHAGQLPGAGEASVTKAV